MSKKLICYCFNFSEAQLAKAFQENKENIIIEEIKAKMKDPGCFCETSNPSGKCCLKDIESFIKNQGGNANE